MLERTRKHDFDGNGPTKLSLWVAQYQLEGTTVLPA